MLILIEQVLSFSQRIGIIVRLVFCCFVQTGEIFFKKQVEPNLRRYKYLVFKTYTFLMGPSSGNLGRQIERDAAMGKVCHQLRRVIAGFEGVAEGLRISRAKTSRFYQSACIRKGADICLAEAVTDKIAFDSDFHVRCA